MKSSTTFQILSSLALLLSLILPDSPALAAGSQPQAQPAQPVNGGQGISLSAAGGSRPAPVALQFDPHAIPNRVDPPSVPAGGLSPQAASFVIDFVANGATNMLGDTCSTFPSQAVAPFQAAAAIWASLINSPVTIRLEACWANLPSGVLGHSATGNYFANFSGAPTANTWYPVALANAFHGSDLDPTSDDISIAYANAFTNSFYFGTDGNDGGKTDFESVVLHEITHGLGFAGLVCASGSAADWGSCLTSNPLYPAIYDRFTFDGANQIINTGVYPHNSSALLAALTSGSVTFNGASARAANGAAPVPLYSPSTWQGGSSYSHLAESFNGTPNALMTFSIGVNEVLHSPGPVTLGILTDIGWAVNSGVVVAAPAGLSASALSSTQIQLTWTPNGAGESGFLVERSPNGSTGWTSLTTVAAPAGSYLDSSASEGTHYYYRVSEVFPGPLSSGPSNVANAITPLLAPTGLNAAPASPTQINLAWTNNSAAATAYSVERSPDGSTGWTTVTTSAGLTGFNNTGLTDGTRYFYRVTATSTLPDSSAASGVASGITPLKPASAVSAAAISPSRVDLAWTNNSATAAAYTVERSPNGTSGWTSLTTSAGLTGFSDTSLTENTTAYYRVTASNTLAQSAPMPAAGPATTYLNPPTGLLAAPVPGKSQILIRWTDASAAETGYQLQFASSAAGPWTNVTPTLPAGSTSFQWTTANGTYFFQVRAVGAAVDSLFTGPTSATLGSNHLFIPAVR